MNALFELRGCGRLVGWGALAMVWVLVAAGCSGGRSWSGQEFEQLRSIDRAYRVGAFDEAEARSSELIDAFPEDGRTGVALYLRGLSRVRLGRREEARADLLRAMRVSKDAELRASVEVQLANFAFDDERYVEAARLYGRVAAHPPRSVGADRLWFRYGVSLIREGRFAEARGALRRVVASFPKSRFAAIAQRKLAWHRDHFSVQCGAFSEARSAGEAARSLRRAGIEASVSRLGRGQATPFVVHAGRYGTYGAAKNALASIRAQRSDAFIVP